MVAKGISIKMFSFFVLSLSIFLACGSASQEAKFEPREKINGVSFVSPSRKFDSSLMALPKTKVNANWICLMPFGFVAKEDTKVHYNSPNQWWGERKEGIAFMHEQAKKEDYKVFLKPQIWKSHGAFTGHHEYDNVQDWQAFEDSYANFILDYARLAENLNIPLFCIGTEWDYFVKERSSFWLKLIQEVRKVYSGKLTYASNWDEYKRVPFWNELDFIGIDAYFPLGNGNKKELNQAWQPIKKRLHHFSDSLNKAILFTEFGYRSKKGSTLKPWESGREGEVDLTIQALAYEVLFENFWSESFFAGGFLWKWFPQYNKVGGEQNNDFTPQRKPAEAIIKKYYLEFSN